MDNGIDMLRATRTSHPSRGEWIEISRLCATRSHDVVAPLTGCVD